MKRASRKRPFGLERMEPRILLSADALGGALDADSLGGDKTDPIAAGSADRLDALLASLPKPRDTDGIDLDNLGEFVSKDSNADDSRLELVFVDASVDDYETLIEGLSADRSGSDFQVHVLDASRDGIEQISAVLEDQQGVDAIHVLSHGNDSGLQLGSSWLDQNSLGSYRDSISGWAAALDAEADILLYGCNLAASGQGIALLDSLAESTGADIAASDDLTGSAALGGDWDLEYHAGQIETLVATNSITLQWSSTLATISVNTTADIADGDTTSIANLIATPGADGNISLREALIAANNTANGGTPDEINFNIGGGGPQTIQLAAALPDITEAVILDATTQPGFGGTPIIELDGSLTTGATGLRITSDGSTVSGLVINRFDEFGIELSGADNNIIQGNYIGTNIAGDTALGNGSDGIYIAGGSSDNLIGGVTAAQRNVISGNDDGVVVRGANTSGNAIQGNYIGTNAAGTADLGNLDDGVIVYDDASNTMIGGDAPGAGNLISGNDSDGIQIGSGSTTIDGITIQGNLIGTDVTGTIAIANVQSAIDLEDATDVLIGGTTANAGNTLAFNIKRGVEIQAGFDATVLSNSIFANTDVGIDHDVDGITANDIGDGDGVQNYPLLTSALTDGSQIVIEGSLNSVASKSYRIEFFASPTQDPTGYGEGQTYLGFTTVTTDGAGNATFSTLLSAAVPANQFITATATEDLGGGDFADTSEFAQNVVATASSILTPPVITERATIDSDADGQIDQIMITTTDALNDDFSGLTVTVEGYSVAGYSTGIANDNTFYVDLVESGTPDTAATPTVTLTANTTLGNADGDIGVDDNWLDPNWLNRAKISFDNSAQTSDDLDDFPLLVTIDTSKLPSLDLSGTVGADVRFTDAITGAELNYEVQSWNQATDEATLWVKVPRIDAGSATDHIYIYYNYNGTATYDQSAADEAAVWPSGTGVYHLEESPGPGNVGDIKDSDGTPNDGTAQNGFATNDLVQGQIGNGIEWESGDDVISFGNADLADNFRISAWVNPTDNGELHTVVANAGPGNSTDGFRFYISDSGQIVFSTGNGSAGNEANSVGGVVNFGEWNHIAIDVDRSTGSAVIYHNGADVTADGTVLNDFNTNSDWVIGTMEGSFNQGNNFLGIIDEVRIGNSTQSADWAKAEYLTQSGADTFSSFASEETVTPGITAIDKAAPVLLSASGINVGTPGLLNNTGDQLSLVFSESINAVPTEADSETNFILSGTDGDNFPTEVGGSTIIASGTTFVANDTIIYSFSAGDIASANLINPGSSTIDVNVGGIVANSIEDAAGNDLADTVTGAAITISNDGANDAPQVDLDTGSGGADYSLTFNEGDGPTAIVDTSVSVFDVDDASLVYVELNVGGVADGAAEELSIGDLSFALDATDFSNISVDIGGNDYTVTWVSATGVATITLNSGEMSLAQAETVLLNTRYQHTDTATPTAGDRTIAVTVNDGDVDSTAVTTTISVADSNDAPVNSVPLAQSTAENTALVFSSGNGNAITVSDIDAAGGNIEVTLVATNGTVSITGAAGDPIQANDTTSGQQTGVAIDRAADGSMVVVWADLGSGGDIFAQRYDSDGNAVGPEFQVNSGAANEQLDPSEAVADNGDFVVVWQSKDQPGDEAEGIYAQRFDSDGNPLGGEFRVNSETANEQTAPEIAMDAGGNFVIVWTSKDQDGSAEGIYGQRYNSAGVAQSGEFRINTETGNEQWQPAVAMDDAGNFVVTWASKDQGSDGSFGVFAQRYNAAGVAQGSEFQVHASRSTEQQAPRVAMDADGDFVIVWESKDQPGDAGFGVYGQRYDRAGVAQGSEFRINTTTGGEQMAPDVAMTPSGGFTVVWESPDADGSGVYAQEYDNAGNPVGSETRVNLGTDGSQFGARIAMDAAGDYIVTWNGESPADDDGIAAQRFLSTQDGLVFSTGDGSNDTTMTFTGSVTDINNALDGLVFNPTADFIGSASLQIVISDLGNTGAGGVQTDDDTIDISVFDAGTPDIDLDGDNSSGAADPNFSASFVEGGGPVAIADTDAVITDTGAPTPNLVSITVRLTNQPNGADEVLTANTTGTNIIANWNSALGRLTLAGVGPEPLTDFEQVLRTITYDNAADNPDTSDRIITFQAFDGVGNSNLATTVVSVEGINDAPVLTAPAASLTATEQTALAVHGTGFSISDADAGDGILEATLTVDHGLIQVASGDSGVSVVSGNASDTVVLTGTRFELNDLLSGIGTGSVNYLADSDDPLPSTTFKVEVNDQGNTGTDPGLTGDAASEAGNAQVTIDILSVNDAPTLTTTAADSNYTVGGGDFAVFTGTSISTIEAGETIQGLTITVSGVEPPSASTEKIKVGGTEVILGDSHLGSQGAVGGFADLTVSQTGPNEFTLTFTGGSNSAADVVSLIDGLTYRNDGSPSANDRVVEIVQIIDSGGTANGGEDTLDLSGVTSTLSLVNVAPTVDLNGAGAGIDFAIAYAAGSPAVSIVDAGVDVADSDDTSIVSLTLRVAGAVDGADEELTIGSLPWTLDAGDFTNNGVTVGADTYTVIWDSTTVIATITLNTGEMTLTQAEAVLQSAQYQHTHGAAATAGDRTINVRADDGDDLSAIATSTVTVSPNTPPDAVDAPNLLDGPEDTWTGVLNAALLANVSDPDAGDTKTITSIQGVGLIGGIQKIAVTNGTVHIDASDNIRFEPNAHHVGPVSFTFTVEDSAGAADTATASGTIAPVNDAPIVSGPGAGLSVNEDVLLNLHGQGFSVAEFDEAGATVAATLRVDEGTISVAEGNSGVVITAGNGSDTVTLSGTVGEINNLLTGAGTGTIQYLSEPVEPLATVTFEVIVNDLGNTGTDPGLTGDGSSEEGAASVGIDINPINDRPTLTTTGTDNGFIGGGGAVSIFTGTTASTIESSQTFIEFDLQVSGVVPPNSGNEVVIIDGASIVLSDGNTGSTTNFSSYSVSRAGNTFTVAFSGGSIDGTTLGGLLDGASYRHDDPTPAGGDRVVEITRIRDSGDTAGPGHHTTNLTGQVSTLGLDEVQVLSGAGATLDYTEGDGAQIIDPSLTITDPDDAEMEGATVTISGGYVSGEDVLDFTPVGAITGSFDSVTGVLTLSGIESKADYEAALESVTYTNTNLLNPNEGDRTITWVVTDNGGISSSAPITSTITVTRANDLPVAADDADILDDDEDTPSGILNAILLANDSDPDIGDSLTITEVNGVALTGGTQTIAVANGRVEIDALDNITFTPDTDYVGAVSFDYTVEDTGGATDTATASGTIVNVNDPVDAVDDPNVLDGVQDISSGILNAALLANDTDADTGDTKTITEIDGVVLTGGTQTIAVTNGTVDIDAADNITFTPGAGYVGAVSFTYTVEDGAGTADTATASGTIAVSVSPPVAVDDPNALDGAEDTNSGVLNAVLLANDTDPDTGDSRSITAINGVALTGGTQTIAVANGTVNVDAADNLSFTPAADYVGAVAFDYTIEDSGGLTDTATASGSIANVNDMPTGDISVTGDAAEGETLGLDVSRLDDADGMGTFNYQWLRDGTPVTGAVGDSYLLGADDVGSVISVTVSYTDSRGTAENVASNASDVVAGRVPVPEPAPDPVDEPDTPTLITDPGGSTGGAADPVVSPPIDDGVRGDVSTDDPAPEPVDEPEPDRAAEDSSAGPSGGDTEAADEGGVAFDSSMLERGRNTVFSAGFSSSGTTADIGSVVLDIALDDAQSLQVALIDNTRPELRDQSVTQVDVQLVAFERLRDLSGSLGDIDAFLSDSGFVDGIDQLREEVIEETRLQKMVVGSGFAISGGLSVGYVIWAARSGILLSSLLSSMPAWRFIDPFPVLSTGKLLAEDEEDEESLVSIAAGEDTEPLEDEDTEHA